MPSISHAHGLHNYKHACTKGAQSTIIVTNKQTHTNTAMNIDSEFKLWATLFLCMLVPFLCNAGLVSAEEGEHVRVLTLDHSNFTDIVSKHNFIVVKFYAPWYAPQCIHSFSVSFFIMVLFG